MYEAIIAILIGLDQVIKHWALNSLKDMETVPVIKNIFNLTYVENRGAAFGMLQNNQNISGSYSIYFWTLLLTY